MTSRSVARSLTARLAAVLTASIALAGCAGGAPPGFSAGESWAFPLVGPLENGALFTPVMIGDHGPYLFVIDPDASVSSIDERIAVELDLYTGLGPRLLDEQDTTRPTKVAEVPAMTIGNLTVKGKIVTLHPVGTYFAEGREVRGVVGRDVLADSLVFGFDRDAGMAYLATRDVFTPPEGAIRLGYRTETIRHEVRRSESSGGPTGAVPRRLASVAINGHKVAMHLDLGAVPSQLRARQWPAAKLAPVPFKVQLVDEVGTTRDVDKGGIANLVVAGGASAMGLSMVPFTDARWDEEDIDGALGLDFFAPYVVWADWHDQAFHLVAREGEADRREQRLARWAAPELAACKTPACTTARLVEEPVEPTPAAPDAAPPPSAPPLVEITRDAHHADLAYEVTLEAVNADGQPLGLARLVATFPRGATTISQRLSPGFAGARFRVLDVSPFVRTCPGGKAGCIFELRR